MNRIAPTNWSTASFGDSPDTTPGELRALGEHLQQCGRGERWARLHIAAAAVHGFGASRFVTTLLVLSVLLATAGLVVGTLVS